MAESFSCAIVVLAAGASTRMGQPKQLLPTGDLPLLRRVVEAAVSSVAAPVIVVLGAHAAAIRPTLAGLPIHVVVNEGWAEGMGSSVRVGMETLVQIAAATKHVIIALGDMPNFSPAHVTKLIEARQQTGRTMVATDHGGRLMPPALFADGHFPALRESQGDAGARALLQTHRDEVARVPATEVFDLDTQADYAAYLKRCDDLSAGTSGR